MKLSLRASVISYLVPMRKNASLVQQVGVISTCRKCQHYTQLSFKKFKNLTPGSTKYVAVAYQLVGLVSKQHQGLLVSTL